MAGRYVALGSSMAAGPGIMPRAQGSPRLAGRSARNYPHQIAGRQGYRLVDVTYSGATTAHILTDSHNNDPPQIDALDGTEELVTVTVGGNDVGYVPFLVAASLPRILRALPVVGRALDALLDPNKREEALAGIGKSLRAVGEQVRDRAPRARVIFIDYLSLLPPEGQPAPPYTLQQSTTGHRIAAALVAATAEAAQATGCEIVHASTASTDHHAWSARPWTTRPAIPWPWRPAPLHPNEDGMTAVADLVVALLNAASND
ncbi:SGNH/GDSL hydrolase family protein [Mycobacteroides abscessus]|uniref:SGNH/GDSL hydrolase family protein n=1 Tax=Mycobacteroides abscessus TaxID=36809 RepID=UPI00266CE245|nr:SGNH/GDSL hydrolase family protein [Mycobacteroides abscessus]MDO2971060.1 SGNH/GDSL hydrolase family protein [Mycobacteroides abscessus subsp. bolletii]MDO3078445.1 SGNH/GDSL hydrolase family protein [Mycobacteroides abscessus subsp. bolletii]